MNKKQVSFHPSIIIAQDNDRLLMGRYDATYPFEIFRLAFNPLGGNPMQAELENGYGPKEALIRELNEEFDPNATAQNGQEWCEPEKILVLRNELVNSPVLVQDLYVDVPSIEGGRKAHTAIYSVFRTEISSRSLETVEESIKNGKRLTTEGFVGITSIERLVSGKDRLAHSAGAVVAKIIDEKIPCLIPGVEVEMLGKPRERYKDYLGEFEYGPKVFST